ncbi:limb region 1 protein homolog, partial [Eumetopias jubatus]|uniref:limb region 1 protein homolog n=1 Tax=Eumetopias jubatus TaxID=34886 RepID=UPI001016F18B
MLVLLALLILGMVWVASALVDKDAASMESLYDLWEFYLPYLYSCISLMGCLLLLLCTPVGLSRMFTVMGQLLVKPTVSVSSCLLNVFTFEHLLGCELAIRNISVFLWA